MRVIRELSELSRALGDQRAVFVPTMGALHAGHGALIRRAAQVAKKSAPVVVSIFVNPTQFGAEEDFARYPRQLEEDARTAGAAGAEIIFAPNTDAIYPPGKPVAIPQLPHIATQPQLEDAQRPTHFAGVCQVVARLFDLVLPSIAIFGEKDYQQLRVVQEMVRNEGNRWLGLRIEAHSTVREPDGLAMSSRNAYLSAADRDRALGIFRALQSAQSARTPELAEASMRHTLKEHHLKVDYAVVRDAKALLAIRSRAGLGRALIAARLGSVRLIDNMAWPSSP